ncbi:MAG TPA: Uma2 family endonuclease [Kofleriaceae bacterium]
MHEPFKKNATYDDLYSIPDGWTGEIIDGNLYAFPRPRVIHVRAITRLSRQLGDYDDDDSPHGWVILAEPEVKLGKHLLVPDLAGWRRERMPEIPDVTAIRLAPDWVCEGLSPSTAWLDRGRKREIYAKAGVAHVWFADPGFRTVDVLELDGKSYRTVKSGAGDARIALRPFRAIELGKLWQR